MSITGIFTFNRRTEQTTCHFSRSQTAELAHATHAAQQVLAEGKKEGLTHFVSIQDKNLYLLVESENVVLFSTDKEIALLPKKILAQISRWVAERKISANELVTEIEASYHAQTQSSTFQYLQQQFQQQSVLETAPCRFEHLTKSDLPEELGGLFRAYCATDATSKKGRLMAGCMFGKTIEAFSASASSTLRFGHSS